MNGKNRRGMLLASEVVKIVIALICISFLVYLLFSLYYSNVNAQKTQQAQATITRLKDIINRINNGSITQESMTNLEPTSWYFFGYVGNENKPNSCAGENCVCICEKISSWSSFWGGKQISTCDQKGVCAAFSNLDGLKSFEINSVSNGGTSIQISKAGKNIEIIPK